MKIEAKLESSIARSKRTSRCREVVNQWGNAQVDDYLEAGKHYPIVQGNSVVPGCFLEAKEMSCGVFGRFNTQVPTRNAQKKSLCARVPKHKSGFSQIRTMVQSKRKNVAVLVINLSPVKLGAKQHRVKRKDKQMW